MRRLNLEMLLLAAFLGLATSASAAPFAYITNNGSDTVSVIDTATNMVVATIPIGHGPLGVAVNQNGTRVYTANHEPDVNGYSVSVIDAATNTVISAVPMGNHQTSGVAVSPNGMRIYTANEGTHTVSVIDAVLAETDPTNAEITTITVGTNPQYVAVHPNGNVVYVTNGNGDSVSVINAATNTVDATISVGNGPHGVVGHPNGSRVYVANYEATTVSIINTTNNNVSTVEVGNFPIGVAIHPNGSRLYVTLGSPTGNTVAIVDTTQAEINPASAVIATVTVGNDPTGIGVHPDGTRVYVANCLSNTVSVISTSTNTIIGSPISVGACPRAVGQFIGPAIAPNFSCIGFEPPMDKGVVTVKKHRALPLKAQLFDNNNAVTDADIIASPVIQISFDSGIGAAVDVTDQALPAGQGTAGNQFTFHDSKWQFNLETKNYTASGTYTINMVSGDVSEYTIDPTCMAKFVIE